MEIRVGTPGDIPAIMLIVGQVVGYMKAYGNKQWNDQYPNPEIIMEDIQNQSLHVAEKSGDIIAFLVLDTVQPPEYKPIPWRLNKPALVIHRFAVHEHFRHLGIASALESHACRVAEVRGVSYLRTDTNSLNTGMQAFLKSRDYVYTGSLNFQKCREPFYCYDKILCQKTSGTVVD